MREELTQGWKREGLICVWQYGIPTMAYSVSRVTWADGTYEKTANGNILLSTGASDEFERGGIYDLAGNLEEWTLEHAEFYELGYCVLRGGNCFDEPDDDYFSVCNRYSRNTTDAAIESGFRVSLF